MGVGATVVAELVRLFSRVGAGHFEESMMRSFWAGLLLVVTTGVSGCSCGASDDVVVGGPQLCVSLAGTTDCDPDGSELDWGTPPAGEVSSVTLRVTNVAGTGSPLEIRDLRITDSQGAARLFDAKLCVPTCDVAVLGLPASIPPNGSAELILTFDATERDGLVPAESLQIVSNSTADDVEPVGTYVRAFIGGLDGCLSGRVDANGDPSDGCECAPTTVDTEYCDGLDNDCDGVVDEDAEGTSIACDTGIGGLCAAGKIACDSGALACVATVSTVEVCDGVDNDCDGTVDEDTGWVAFNEGLSGGNMSAVGYDTRSPSVAYAVTGNHVYRSDDAGASFQRVGTAMQNITQFAFPADQPTVVLAASGAGLLRSEDEGVTWSVVSLVGFPLVSILTHPADPARLFVGTVGGGIYRSTNGGQSFDSVNEGVPYSRVDSIVGHPTDPDIVMAGLGLLTAQSTLSNVGAIVKTVNGGANWVDVAGPTGRITGLAACPTDGNILYAAAYGDGVLQSQNGGNSWTLAGLVGDQVSGIAVAPADCMTAYVGTEFGGIYMTDDGGAQFDGPYTSGLDVQRPGNPRLSAHPTSVGSLLMANHSGVFHSTSAASDWTRVGTIDAAQVSALSVSAAAPGVVWMGTWGQGLWVRDGAASDWARVPSTTLPRDWSITLSADAANDQRVVVGALGDVWQTEDAGTSFVTVAGPANVLRVAFDASDADVLFLATQVGGVWKSSDGGNSYAQKNVGLPPAWDTGVCTCQDVRSIVVDRADSDRIYLGTHLQGMFLSADGGESWQSTAPELAGETINCLAQHTTSDLYACVTGEGIWRSVDGGQTYAKLTQGLAYLNNVSGILVDDATGDLYATSDGGVYRTADEGVTWGDLDSQCLPSSSTKYPVIMREQGQRTLLVGSGGDGVYALPL